MTALIVRSVRTFVGHLVFLRDDSDNHAAHLGKQAWRLIVKKEILTSDSVRKRRECLDATDLQASALEHCRGAPIRPFVELYYIVIRLYSG